MDALRRFGPNRPLTPARPAAPPPRAAAPAPAGPSALASRLFTAPTRGNSIALHLTPAEANDALLASIRDAKRSFDLLTYIWHADEAGFAVAHALVARKQAAEAKGEPFEARVLVDALGLRNQPKGRAFDEVRKILEAGGVEVQVANRRLVSLSPLALPLEHRKLAIADGARFITGGRNVADEYLRETWRTDDGRVEPAWRDLAYTVEGPETGRIQAAFNQAWARAGGKPSAVERPPAPAVPPGSALVQTFETDPLKGTQDIRALHQALVAGARREIVAIYPYLSDDTLVADLIAAKRKSPALRVRVLLPARKENGMAAPFRILHRDTAATLMAAGIEVRFFGGEKVDGKVIPRVSHLKAMLVDGELLSLGSANGDPRSFSANHELNTLIRDPGTVAAFRARVVDPDWRDAEAIPAAELARRPLGERVLARILEALDFLS